MEGEREWMRSLFEALTSRRLSRNKYFASFERGWGRIVHRRYRVVRALKSEAERLAGIPDSFCRVRMAADGVQISLHSPRLQYRREAALLPHEWEWLNRQEEVRQLLQAPGGDAAPPAPPRLER